MNQTNNWDGYYSNTFTGGIWQPPTTLPWQPWVVEPQSSLLTAEELTRIGEKVKAQAQLQQKVGGMSFDKAKHSVALFTIDPFNFYGSYEAVEGAARAARQLLSAAKGQHAGFVIFQANRVIRPKPIETEEEEL